MSCLNRNYCVHNVYFVDTGLTCKHVIFIRQTQYFRLFLAEISFLFDTNKNKKPHSSNYINLFLPIETYSDSKQCFCMSQVGQIVSYKRAMCILTFYESLWTKYLFSVKFQHLNNTVYKCLLYPRYVHVTTGSWKLVLNT